MRLTAAKKDDSRARIRELFLVADQAKRAHSDAEARTEKLDAKLKELNSSLPGLRQIIKDREYAWRMAQAKLEVREATEADEDVCAKAIDAARAALEEAEGKIVATEDLIAEASNKIGGLRLHAEHALLAAWRALRDDLEPAALAAAEKFRRFYAAEINAIVSPEGVPPDAFLRRHIDLRGSHLVAVEIEKEYRT
jgi:predicted  nucleic acid-binding Zn-ribbon protein